MEPSMDMTCEIVNSEMSTVSYDEVLQYYRSNNWAWKGLLDELDRQVTAARDRIPENGQKPIPVYSTKCRVKAPESIYLKLRRQGRGLNEIKDCAGMRVLCLFEEGISEINSELIQIILHLGLVLEECKVYNFDDTILVDGIKNSTKTSFPSVRFGLMKKLSGYKSVHYIVRHGNDDGSKYAEIQLRTLLQDVWGELEHNLSYKRGAIHPHIKKSFSLLARDIQTNDMLMSHLRDINEKEATKDRYAVQKNGLRHYFEYDEGCYPQELLNENVRGLCEQYESTMKQIVAKKHESDGLVGEAWNHLKALRKQVDEIFPDGVVADERLRYWFQMEEALLFSMDRCYDDALRMYRELVPSYNDKYILHFRIGEMHFILGKTVDALCEFDISQRMLEASLSGNETSAVRCKNLVTIKRKLAYTFWLLGDQYIDRSIQLTHSILALLREKANIFRDDTEYHALCNNLCWYVMQKWQLMIKEEEGCSGEKLKSHRIKTDKCKSVVDFWYGELISAMDKCRERKIVIPSNWYDTVAFYCCCMYKATRNPVYRDKAKDYAVDCDKGTNYATLGLTSLSIHISHITEILSLT